MTNDQLNKLRDAIYAIADASESIDELVNEMKAAGQTKGLPDLDAVNENLKVLKKNQAGSKTVSTMQPQIGTWLNRSAMTLKSKKLRLKQLSR